MAESKKAKQQLAIGCAGWSISKDHAEAFPGAGSHLARYAERLPVVEINSSFYRPHQPSTYAKWAAAVPRDFRFSVKVPKDITHNRRLVDVDEVFTRFLNESQQLGEKLGALLVQLPPSFGFELAVAERFFELVRSKYDGDIVCEPRHRTWFTESASQLLTTYRISRVAADPASVAAAAEPGGWGGCVYFRLHGSPKMYYSSYSSDYLGVLATKLAKFSATSKVWCIFDNTAAGAAIVNAFELLRFSTSM